MSRRRWIAVIVFALLFAGGVYFRSLVVNAPGGQDVVDDTSEPDRRPDEPSEILAVLRAPWDSEKRSDWPVAEVLGDISQNAYLPPVEAMPQYKASGFSQADTFLHSSMVGYVLVVDDVGVIVFRGTDDLPDWIVNADRSPTKTPHGNVHRGFWNAYQTLKPQILKAIGNSPPKYLWVTGHSLGGALAVVCAYELSSNEKIPVAGVITYGQPLVTDASLAKHIDDKLRGHYATFANGKDIVTRIPPGYAPCGSLVWFTEKGVKRSLPKGGVFAASPDDVISDEFEEIKPINEDEFKHLQEQIREEAAEPEMIDGRPVMKGDSPYIQDHSMANYLEKIRAFRKPQEPQ